MKARLSGGDGRRDDLRRDDRNCRCCYSDSQFRNSCPHFDRRRLYHSFHSEYRFRSDNREHWCRVSRCKCLRSDRHRSHHRDCCLCNSRFHSRRQKPVLYPVTEPIWLPALPVRHLLHRYYLLYLGLGQNPPCRKTSRRTKPV